MSKWHITGGGWEGEVGKRGQWINRNNFLRAKGSVIKTSRSFLDRKERKWRRGCSRGRRWGEGRGHHIACPQSLSHVLLFVTPWTVTHQAPLSMEFSRLEYWSGLPSPPPGNSSVPGSEPTSLASPALAGGFFTAPPRKPSHHCSRLRWSFLLCASSVPGGLSGPLSVPRRWPISVRGFLSSGPLTTPVAKELEGMGGSLPFVIS